MSAFYRIVKRGFDIVSSFLGIVVTSPLWLIAVIGIEISDPGPVFYIAKRIGKGNRQFNMLKFRSMRRGKANEAAFRGDEDRIFPFGRLIRTLKIDELPQLINVLTGTMSVVGPRPAAVDQMHITRGGRFAAAGDVQAGLTGPSALFDYIYGDRVTNAEEYEAKVLPVRLELDLVYLERKGIGFDLKMIWWTVICLAATVFRKTPQRMLNLLIQWGEDHCPEPERKVLTKQEERIP